MKPLADKNPAQNQAPAQFQDILIAIGANLIGPLGETPAQTVLAAAEVLTLLFAQFFENSRCQLSSLYSSAPVPISDQPRFINAVLRVACGAGHSIDPATLLQKLHDIEARFGRTRSIANAARTLDLDLITYKEEVISTPTLTLPHPRAHERLFVLLPLRDVAPNWRHPVSRELISDLIASLAPADIRAESLFGNSV